jgi:signal transduction histidine kinase
VALDEHGTIIEANAAAASILGHERPRLVGKPLAATVVLDDRRALRHAIGHATAADELINVRVHGSEDPWTLSLRSLPHVVPRTLVAAFVPQNEAQRRYAEPRPRTGTRRPSEALERIALRFPHAVVALRHDGRVAFANTRARTLLGREAVRAGGQFGDGVSPELRATARRLIEVPAPLRPTLVELTDGRVARVSGLASTADDPAILYLEDVTEQHVQERVTREFLRNAAHQLRTPLAGITAAIETLQAGAKERPEDRDRFLAHLETHATRLTRIARGLLVLARAQTGEQLRVDFVELRPLLDTVAGSIEPQDGIDVQTYCEPGLAALASPELLHETLAALVENAVSHTGAGTIRLNAVANNGQVALSVTDSGRGILPEFRARVFEPFYRIGDDGKGYGLGLAIAAQAVAAMDGEIEVSQAPQGGTTFTVTLRSATVLR